MRTDDERDHARAVTTGGFETFDQLLDLPYLDVLLGVSALSLGGCRRHDGRGWLMVCVGSGGGYSSGAEIFAQAGEGEEPAYGGP